MEEKPSIVSKFKSYAGYQLIGAADKLVDFSNIVWAFGRKHKIASSVCFNICHAFENASDKTDRISRRLLPSLNPSEIIIKAAHHETGHAIVEMKIPQSRRVLSIVLLEDEAYVNLKTRKIVQENSRENIICEIACWLAGLTNEKLHLGSMVKKHALEDIYKAVSLAYSAVNNFSPKDVKKITYEDASNYARSIDLEKDSFSCFQISPNDSEAVIRQKSEILKALDAGWNMAEKILRENMSASEEIAKNLLKKRILMGEEFEALLEKTSPR